MYCNKCGNPIEPNSKFCNRCGNPLNNSNNNTINISNSKSNILSDLSNNKKMIFIGVGIGLGIFLVFFVIINIFGGSSSGYYFNTNPNQNNSDNVVTVENTPKKGVYRTAIIYDNTYSGVKIEKDADAFSLIVKDSVSQKNNCPKDIKAVEDDIIKKYGVTAVNLCEMDVGFAKEIEKVFKKIYDEYPSVRGYITNFTLVNGSISDNYIAAFLPIFNFATSDSDSTYPWVIKTQILLNTTYFLNKDRLAIAVKDSSNSGHFPKNATIYSPVAHEFGHYLSFLAMMKHHKMKKLLLINSDNSDILYSVYADFVNGNYSLDMINEAFDNYKKDKNTNMSLDEWRGTISKYALAKDNSGQYIYDETIAESFHDVYLNGNNACDASKYVIAVLKKRLKG
ncbi:MAG: zinc ribbon domain-containing protein [Bacilli bacterium]|nr:zinc ribbon domain-containing protein [Bacilli bacterium]